METHRSAAPPGTTSLWQGTHPSAPPRSTPIPDSTQVCVIGAGISGLTAAVLLAREGRDVTVLDKGPVGGGETGRTTAHLSNALDDRYMHLLKVHGEERTRLAAAAHTAAIDLIEELVSSGNIQCGFRRLDGFLFCGPGHDDAYLRKELSAAHEAGLEAVGVVTGPGFAGAEAPMLRFPRQARLHSLRYLDGLVALLEAHGGRIVTDAHVLKVAGGAKPTIHLADGRAVACDAGIVATNAPLYSSIYVRQAAYRTYALALESPPGAIPDALYWDTMSPYHYVRVVQEGDQEFVIVGGEDHRTGQGDDGAERFVRLEAWARENVPGAGAVRYRWSGQVLEPDDGLAFIGPYPGEEMRNLYMITGDSGMGMTHGTLGAKLVSDQVCGRENPWAEAFDPARKRGGATLESLKENLNTAAHLASGKLSVHMGGADGIPADSGAVLGAGPTKHAVYRDAAGKLHTLDAACTHKGCTVSWNATEKSWDCPCHGSRFDATGAVISAPALEPLKPIPSPTD